MEEWEIRFRGTVLTEKEYHSLPIYALGATNRLEIIEELRKGERTQNELAKKLDSRSENIQNANKWLIEHWWIQKNGGNLQLTPWAMEMYDILIPSISFMHKHKEYFLDHDFGDVPEHFKQGIGCFENCDFIENNVAIRLKEKEILDNSKSISYNLLSDGEYSEERMKKLIEKFKACKPFHLRTILSKNAVMPEDVKTWRKKIDKIIEKFDGLRELKLSEKITVGLVMNEKEALVIFPKLKKTVPDMNYAFYGNEKNFLQWCFDYFNFCQNKAESKNIN